MMNVLLQIWTRLLSLTRRGRLGREMEEAMSFHLEMQIGQNPDKGMTLEEAHHAARRQFGNQTWLKEASRLLRKTSADCPVYGTCLAVDLGQTVCAAPFAISISFSAADPKPGLLLQEVHFFSKRLFNKRA